MSGIRNSILVLFAIFVVVLIIGCSSGQETVTSASKQKKAGNKLDSDKKALAETSPESIDLEKVKPNELGKVLILEYHEVGDTEARWERHYDNFRKDLERLHTLGYYPISLRDFVNNEIKVPAGKSPIVITFDDGTAGQFNYIYEDGKKKVDPNCAVAIMEEFSKRHPDFPLEATFYIYYPLPFRQKDDIGEKIKYILSRGMDIGNHTYTHTRLDLDSDTEAAKEMALHVKATKKYAPEAVVDSIALPYGKRPKSDAMLVSGSCQGTKYKNIAALLVGAQPAPSPVSADFDPYRLPRVQAIQSELDTWLGQFKNHPDRRYVSDGDPNTITVPKELAESVDTKKLRDKKLRTY